MAELDDDVDFGDPTELNVGGLSQARWDRVKHDIDVRDVVDVLHGRRGSPISCPFHGRDSKPSFYFFPENNDATCYGCDEGDNYWDNVKIVARSLDISRTKALFWLEREFNLPPLQDDTSEVAEEIIDLDAPEDPEEDEEPELLVGFEDLKGPYITHVQNVVIAQSEDPDVVLVAQSLIEQFFTAEKHDDPKPLARVLGADEVRRIIRMKHLG